MQQLARKQETVDLGDMSAAYVGIVTTQMEGGTSNSNSQMMDNQDSKPDPAPEDDYWQQQTQKK